MPPKEPRERINPPQSPSEIEKRFTYQPPKGDQPQRYGEMRAKALEMAVFIQGHTPASREQALALTKLDEVVFWANAAIARNE